MRRKIGSICIGIGVILLLGALSLLAYNQWDDWRAGKAVSEVLEVLKSTEQVAMDNGEQKAFLSKDADENGETEAAFLMPMIMVEENGYIGTLSIPRFGLELPILSEWSEEGMKIAPGRYTGSVWTDDMVLCGHNYARHFGNLQYMEVGDTVIFTDVLDNVFEYEVQEIELIDGTAVEEMITGEWDLTLFTCNYSGQARVTVRCRRISV